MATLLERRIQLLFAGFMVLLSIGLVRALYLGSVRSGALKHAANVQQVSTVPLPAERGEITDRNGTVLALSQAADDVIADPNLSTKKTQDAQLLSKILGIPALTLQVELSKDSGYAVIAKRIPITQAKQAQEAMAKIQQPLSLVQDTKRVYPQGWTAAQVVGWTEDSDNNGATGIEYQYDKALRGTSGERKQVATRSGQVISVKDLRAAKAGKTVKLTIDSQLENQVEQVLAGVGKTYSPKLATAIVMNPQTGKILALANWPDVNANSPYAEPTADSRDNADQDHAVSFTYEPGSTFKAFTVAGALQDNLISPDTSFDVPPALYPYGTKITDAEAHGYVQYTTAKILQVSSNIGADLIGQRLGADRFNDWVHTFGFGTSTGVDLPGEADGSILEPKNYSGTSMYNLPFGQGEAVTPMQIATAYAAIANGGILRSPRIVDSVGGRAVKEPRGKRVISPEVASELRTMLRGVYADGGTASGAAIAGYDMAGKTGTANVAVDGSYSKTEYVASFVGMVPVNHPKLLGLVVVDEPNGSIFGGSVAAPAFQKIVGYAVPYLGINPR